MKSLSGPLEAFSQKHSHTKTHTQTACQVTSPIHESCTACIVGVARGTSARPPTRAASILLTAPLGLPDAPVTVKSPTTRYKGGARRGSCCLFVQDLLQSCSHGGTREEPGTLRQGAPVSSRLGIEPPTPGWLVVRPPATLEFPCSRPHVTPLC
jgi:hypothetical protein